MIIDVRSSAGEKGGGGEGEGKGEIKFHSRIQKSQK